LNYEECFELFQSKYNIYFDYLQEGPPASIFKDFMTKITTKIDKPVFVLTD